MSRIAYVRVSTIDQNPDRQLELLKTYNIDQVFIEKASGKDTKRPVLQQMLTYCRKYEMPKGLTKDEEEERKDVVYVESFSRLARNVRDLLNIVETLAQKDVKIISLKENFDTSTSNGKMMLTMLGAVSEFERDILLERQREGIAIAKGKGKYKGRKEKIAPDNFSDLYNQYRTRKYNKCQLAKLCQVSRPIIDKWIKEHEEKISNGVLF